MTISIATFRIKTSEITRAIVVARNTISFATGAADIQIQSATDSVTTEIATRMTSILLFHSPARDITTPATVEWFRTYECV
jgi:hypothetical protein